MSTCRQVVQLLLLLLSSLTVICNTKIIFGFETSNKAPASVSTNTITLTLYWSSLKYQCNVYPTELDILYFCDTSHQTTTTFKCDTTTSSNPVKYGLEIDNEGTDAVGVDRINITNIQQNGIIVFA